MQLHLLVLRERKNMFLAWQFWRSSAAQSWLSYPTMLISFLQYGGIRHAAVMILLRETKRKLRCDFLRGALRPMQKQISANFRPLPCKMIKSAGAFSILYSRLQKAFVFIDSYTDLVRITILKMDCVAVKCLRLH